MEPNKTLSRRDVLRAAGAAAAATVVAPTAQAQAGSIGMALVGAAHIHTGEYVDALKNRKNVHTKYVWDHDSARAARAAKSLGAVTADLSQIWSDPEVSAIVVCSETNRHHELVLASSRAKKHMFVEKPLGITARESFAMARAIEGARLLFNTGYFMRTSPEHIFLRDQIAQGNLGKVTRVRGSNCHSGSLGGWFDGEFRWMADPKIAGVGAFGDLGTHSLDILMWLMGGVKSATADIKIVTDRYPGCDESGEALLKFKNGVTGTLAAGWVDVDNPVTLLVSGTEGHAYIANGRLFYRSSKVPGARGREPWTELPSAPAAPIEAFFAALESKNGSGLVQPMDAAARVAVMEACYQGAHSQSWVKVAQA